MGIWDKLYPQNGTDHLIEQIYGQSSGAQSGAGPQTTLTGGAVSGQQGQLSPAGQAIAATLPSLGGLFGQLTPQQISQMLQGYTTGMTKEEGEELERLLADYKAEIKKHKLLVFKKCSPDLRQFVINVLTWREVTGQINNIIVEKSDRLKELENKSAYSGIFGAGSHLSSHWSTGATSGFHHSFDPSAVHQMMSLSLPEGITAEELKQVHLEATLEEEMLDGEKE